MRLTGLEPARRETPDPKSDASTNSATGACTMRVLAFAGAKVRNKSETTKFSPQKVEKTTVFVSANTRRGCRSSRSTPCERVYDSSGVLLGEKSAGELNDGVTAFHDIGFSELHIVVGLYTELDGLLLCIVHGNGREAYGPAVGQ